jgi:hypothetical protein
MAISTKKIRHLSVVRGRLSVVSQAQRQNKTLDRSQFEGCEQSVKTQPAATASILGE